MYARGTFLDLPWKETMSRIHEALKRAELERTMAQATDAGRAMPRQMPPPSMPSNGEYSSADKTSAKSAAFTIPPDGHLRFEDLRMHCWHPSWHPDPNVNVFHNPETTWQGAEQFRKLRARLYQLRTDNAKPFRTLLVTSAISSEGKTFVVSNLAQSIVRQPGHTALIIDADMRRSRLHLPFGAPTAPGLTDYLGGNADEMAVIQQGQESNLFLIAGGSDVQNPSELLSNGRLKALLGRTAPLFDWVFIDSPPYLPVADSGVLADLCDGVLLVVQAGVTTAAAAQKTCHDLRNRNIIGVVLNGVGPAHVYGGSGRYSHGDDANPGDHKDSSK
jgi:capsular exopolysaccharide synthesis family protein